MNKFIGLGMIYSGVIMIAVSIGVIEMMITGNLVSPMETYGGFVAAIMLILLFPVCGIAGIVYGIIYQYTDD